MFIYLAGFIHGKKLKECTEWRLKIRNHYLSTGWPLEFLDPLNGKELGTISNDGLKADVPASAIVDRDFASVKKADLIIANLDRFGEDRVPVGTISELSWAWMLQKPIIVISNELQYIDHPFITKFASWIVPSIEILFKEQIIDYMYGGVSQAIYTEKDVS